MVTTVESAIDNEPMPDTDAGQDWVISWHPPAMPPAGTPHGSSAVCLTGGGEVVLVRTGDGGWTIPGGRSEPGETWEETLHREVAEEACATVTGSTLLGWGQAHCIRGHEAGKVLVRSLWLAHTVVDAWEPAFEMTERILLPPAQALEAVLPYLTLAHQRITRRLFLEAMRRAGGDIAAT
jgi:ADP-ribose pyrophosphatase YjhB (NUDIX family)